MRSIADYTRSTEWRNDMKKTEAPRAERILRPPEAAAKLSIGRQTLYLWVKKGLLPAPIRVGIRASGWRESTLDKFIEAREAATQAAR